MATATDRRRRRVWWAKRLRRIGLAWDNALELARAGRLSAPYGAPFDVMHAERVYRLRRYAHGDVPGAPTAPLLLVPPLMVASEVYDIAPDVSAVAYLAQQGIDVWLVDFGAPEREDGGMARTLDDHVRAVSDAVDRVHAATGHDVHLAGYSQGGMFCYQAAAFKKTAHVASIITMGSPVDLRRQLPVTEDIAERITRVASRLLEWPLERIEGLPGALTSTGFKLVSARKEAAQLVDFVRHLHDRAALEKREAKRLFLGGDGFVAWPGPAFRKFVDEVIVGNRMASGGFVIDGHAVSLADLTCPILYFVGTRDEIGRPASVRGIRRAAPHVTRLYEAQVKAGHFGIVVGSAALAVTWAGVVTWMRGELPPGAVDARAERPRAQLEPIDDDADDDAGPVELVRELAAKTAHAAVDRLEELGEDLGAYIDNARWQVPRLARLRNLSDATRISLGRSLAEQAERIGDRTFFLWRGRAFTYADANRRVDAVARGLVSCGVKAGTRVAVVMRSRPSHLSAVAAINRVGAIAVLISPELDGAVLSRALDAGEAELAIVDPDHAARVRAATPIKLLALGGVGEQGDLPPGMERPARAIPAGVTDPAGAKPPARVIPPGVIDLEAIDPAQVALPGWYRPDPGRARDLAMIFVSASPDVRATRVTNRRWAFSALGAAAAATLTTRDTVYCCLPLHHPTGTLVASGSALAGGARLALASRFDPDTFWDEVRRYGVSVVYYAGEMCRSLVDAPAAPGEQNTPVRLFAGSGMRPDVWRRLTARFGPVGVLELYASSEASAVLANARGKKIGSVGRPLPGSAEVVVAAWNDATADFARDADGRLIRARLDEPGMVVARLAERAASEVAHIDPRRILRNAFEEGDTWFVTDDLMKVDAVGDYWFVDRRADMIHTAQGPVASRRIEDALYACGGVARCVAFGRAAGAHQQPVAAVQLRGAVALDGADALDTLSAAVAALPEYARPRRLRVVATLAMTDGFRPLEHGVDVDAPGGFDWDPRAQRYVAARDIELVG